jgi:hypothetical protein
VKKKLIFARKCDWCNRKIILNGKDSDSYVVTAEWKYFCLIQTPGKPAERDCMADYLNHTKQKLYEHTFKKELEKKEEEQKEKEEKETRLASAPRMTKLADDFLAELKQREFNKRSKHPT